MPGQTAQTSQPLPLSEVRRFPGGVLGCLGVHAPRMALSCRPPVRLLSGHLIEETVVAEATGVGDLIVETVPSAGNGAPVVESGDTRQAEHLHPPADQATCHNPNQSPSRSKASWKSWTRDMASCGWIATGCPALTTSMLRRRRYDGSASGLVT